MISQAISSESTSRVHVMDCQGDLVIQAADGSAVSVEHADALPETQQDGETLIVRPASGGLHLLVPTAVTVVVENVRGALSVSGVGALSVDRADSGVRVEAITGAVMLRDLDGDLYVRDAASLIVEDEPRNRRQTGRERGVRDVRIHNVRAVEVANIGCSLELREAQTVRVENVGGSCTIDGIAGDLQIANIGGACTIERVGGELQLDNVGGGASLNAIGSVKTLGNVGGNLTMRAAPLNAFSPDHSLHIAVGGTARIELPDEVNLTVHAIAGGMIYAGEAKVASQGTLVYGNGVAHLHLIAGGDGELIGGGAPRIASDARSGWRGIGEELAREIGRAISGEISEWSYQRKHPKDARGAKAPGPFMQSTMPPMPATGPTVRRASPAQDNQAEREAILRMVAAGQVSPEDGDAMLEALGAEG